MGCAWLWVWVLFWFSLVYIRLFSLLVMLFLVYWLVYCCLVGGLGLVGLLIVLFAWFNIVLIATGCCVVCLLCCLAYG